MGRTQRISSRLVCQSDLQAKQWPIACHEEIARNGCKSLTLKAQAGLGRSLKNGMMTAESLAQRLEPLVRFIQNQLGFGKALSFASTTLSTSPVFSRVFSFWPGRVSREERIILPPRASIVME